MSANYDFTGRIPRDQSFSNMTVHNNLKALRALIQHSLVAPNIDSFDVRADFVNTIPLEPTSILDIVDLLGNVIGQVTIGSDTLDVVLTGTLYSGMASLPPQTPFAYVAGYKAIAPYIFNMLITSPVNKITKATLDETGALFMNTHTLIGSDTGTGNVSQPRDAYLTEKSTRKPC